MCDVITNVLWHVIIIYYYIILCCITTGPPRGTDRSGCLLLAPVLRPWEVWEVIPELLMMMMMMMMMMVMLCCCAKLNVWGLECKLYTMYLQILYL